MRSSTFRRLLNLWPPLLRASAAGGNKVLRWFEVDVKTAGGEVVARVRKQLYVRLKPARRGED